MKQTQELKQVQGLVLSPQMQQALHLLQLPVQELSTVIEEAVAENPLLEIPIERDFRPQAKGREQDDLRAFIENSLCVEESLFAFLMRQAEETFTTKNELYLAEQIIGDLDEDGFLKSPLEELALFANCNACELEKLLPTLQTFEPVGVCAKSLHESLLIQLRSYGKEKSLAGQIIQSHFDDLLRNRIPLIAKSLKKTPQNIRQTIEEEISNLDLHPGANFTRGHYKQFCSHIIPDIRIESEEDHFAIAINNDLIPPLRFNEEYLDLLDEEQASDEDKSYIREKISSGKWLMRNIDERNHTLYRIAKQILESQVHYFSDPRAHLKPLTMKEIAEKLQLHESTIARAVSGKHISCERGILPMRSFFTNAYTTDSGESISSTKVKEMLRDILADEDCKSPLSDDAISLMIKGKGVPCARRTVAKYRKELGIGNKAQRKIH